MIDLHIYEYFECEWVIAPSLKEAESILSLDCNPPICEREPDDLVQVPDDKTMRFRCGDDGLPCEGEGTQVRDLPAGEWAKLIGHGYLGNTE